MAFRLLQTPRFEDYPRLSPSKLRPEFAGKSVLVTGGGQGIGAAIAHSFAEAGASEIHISGRTEKTLKGTAASIQAAFPEAKVAYHVADVSSAGDVGHLFASIGRNPDILVNNAGFMPVNDAFVDADLTEWWAAFDTNVRGTALVLQAWLRGRRSQRVPSEPAPAPGVAVTVSSASALYWPIPGQSGYAASKAAQARLAEILTAEVPASEARFVSVHPGNVKTDMYDKSPHAASMAPATDVALAAHFVVWAASTEAAFLGGRIAWANWDVDELLSKKLEILAKDLLKTDLREELVNKGIVPS